MIFVKIKMGEEIRQNRVDRAAYAVREATNKFANSVRKLLGRKTKDMEQQPVANIREEKLKIQTNIKKSLNQGR